MEGQYNLRSPSVKRLMREAKELHEPTEQYFAQPLEDNLFEWHFTVRGPPESDFDSGCYHGRIVLPPEYPMKPPSILLLTPNGRFEVGKKICLSISGHHPETWQPSWSIRTVLLAIIGFMPTQGGGAIGSLDYTTAERRLLAKKSQTWRCDTCESCNKEMLKEPSDSVESKKAEQEAKDLAAQISFKEETPKTSSPSKESSTAVPTTTAPVGAVQPPANVGLMGAVWAPPNTVNNTTELQPAQVTNIEHPQKDTQEELSTDNAPRVNTNNENTSVPTQPATEQNSTDNASLRQRVVSSTTGSTNTTQETRTVNSVRRSSGNCTLVLIWIVALLLAMLVFRRVYYVNV